MEAADQCGSKRTLLSSEWGRFLHRCDRAKFLPTPLWCDLSPAEWLVRRMGKNLYMQTATWLVSRELTAAAGPWDTRLLSDDDQEYFCRVLLASDGVRFVPGARVYYRASGSGSLSYIGTSEKKREAHWLSLQLHIGYLRSLEDSERARAALCAVPARPDGCFLSRTDAHLPAGRGIVQQPGRTVGGAAIVLEVRVDQAIIWLESG